jgi:hypothetical protein
VSILIKVGDIVTGPQFPETVEIKKKEIINDEFVSVAALGRDSNQYYDLMLEECELSSIERLNKQSVDKVEGNVQDIQHFLQYHAFQVDERYSKGRPLGNNNLLPLPHQVEAVYSQMLQVPQVRSCLQMTPERVKRSCPVC